jgi:Tol biopolymer transport system component
MPAGRPRASVSPRRAFGLAASVAAVMAVTAAGWAAWSGTARATGQIGEAEFREYPPILLVFGRCCVGTRAGDLYVVRADGTGLRRLKHWGTPFGVDNKAFGAYLALWSHDRSSIALALAVTFNGDPDTAVHLISKDGQNLRRLSEWCRLLETWSPDGKKLFHSNWGCVGYEKLRSVPVTGGKSRPVRIAAAWNPRIAEPDWSRDGRIAAILSSRDRDTFSDGIVTMNSEGRRLMRITRGDDFRPTWAPSGRAILFTRETYDARADEYAQNVYLVGADGKRLRALTSDGASWGPDWSPDGRKILFLRPGENREKPKKSGTDLWLMDANGGRQTRLPFNRTGWDVLSADWGS